MQAMLKTGLYSRVDAKVCHNAADHHVFFALCRQILQQTALFFKRTACRLDESPFSGQGLKFGIDRKLIISDGKAGAWAIIVLNKDDLDPLLTSDLKQRLDITDKLLERI